MAKKVPDYNQSYDRPLIGHFGKAFNAIPIQRAKDLAQKGQGKISYI